MRFPREKARGPDRVWRKPCLRGAFGGRTWCCGGRGKGVSEAGGARCPLGLSSVSHPKPDKCSPRISRTLAHSAPTPANGSSALPWLRSQTWVSLDSSLFLTPTSNPSANPGGSTIKADPECSGPLPPPSTCGCVATATPGGPPCFCPQP